MKKFLIIVCILFFLSWSFFIFVLGGFYTFDNLDKLNSQELDKEFVEDVFSCKNLTLENTSICLNSYVSSFFVYNKTDDALILGLQSLKQRGGDCANWAVLYKNMAEELGFYGTIHRIKSSNETDHVFMTIGDNTGYCRLDQTSEPDCFMYGTKSQ